MSVSLKDTKQIFLNALDHGSFADREAYLLEECGNDRELLDQVRKLLEAHEDEDEDYDFLDSSRLSSRSSIFPLSTLNRERESDDIGTIGDYELLEVIGRGAMGVVYRAKQISLNREVAVKMIRGSFLSTESDVARFRQEAEAAANLKHPNIVPIYEIREIDDIVFFSMELLDGGSMSDRMKEMRRHPREVVEKLALIARAMHVAHINGIIHRDVKPSNILLDSEGKPYLTDFGLAKNTSSELGHTLSGHLIGTPGYMAPEQASKNQSLTILADVYSLGAVLYEILTGKPPFTGESLMEVLELLRESRPESPSRLNPEVNRDLETIAMKCLEREPGNRYSSANHLADELERWLRGEPIEARPVGRLVRTGQWIKRQPVLAGAIGLAIVLLLTLAIGGPISALRETRLKEEAQTSEANTREARDQLRRELYASEMRLAFQISEQADGIPQLKTMLERWKPDNDLRGWEWDYLHGLTQRGIFESVPDNRRYASPSWRPDTDQLIIHYGSGPNQAEVWNWRTQTLEDKIEVPRGQFNWISKNIAIVTQNDGSEVQVDFEENTRNPLKSRPSIANQQKLTAGRWNASGHYYAFIESNKFRIWSASEERFLGPYPLSGNTNHLEWSPDGNKLAIAGLYQGCVIWDTGTQTITVLEEGNQYTGHGPLAWHPSKPLLVVANQKTNTARIWDIEKRSAVRELSVPGAVRAFAWSPSGQKLATGGGDAVVRVWETDAYRTVATFPPSQKRRQGVSRLSWSRDEERLAASYSYGQVKAWDLGRERRLTHPVVSRTFQAIWSPDGRRVISTGLGDDSGLHHLDLKSGKLSPVAGAPPWILSMSWNRLSGQVVASTLSENLLLLFEEGNESTYRTASLLPFARQSDGEFPQTLFDPTGERLALIRPEAIEIKSFPNGEFTRIPVDYATRAGSWSPNGHYLVTSSEKGFCLTDTVAMKQVKLVETPLGYRRIAWSPDGKKLAVPNSMEPKISIWDLETQSWSNEVMGHSGSIACVAWNPLGRRLASAEGTNILIWDTETWDLLGVLRQHTQLIRDLVWSPDGRSLLSLGGDQLLVWEVE